MQKYIKNKNFIMCVICFIGIILSFVLFSTNSTVSDLSIFDAKKDINNKYEAPKAITFVEKIGLMYLTSGVGYQFGVSDEVVEIGLQTLMSSNLDTSSNQDDNSIIVDASEVIATEEDAQEIVDETLNSEPNWDEVYKKSTFKTLDENGDEIDENDTILQFTTPYNFDIKDIDTTSNFWQLNYRMYGGCLTGMRESYWGSQLFNEDIYYDRAWTSLKWLCQDYLNAVVIEDTDTTYNAIIYSADEKYYWSLFLDKLENSNALDENQKCNLIGMTVLPISKDEVSLILSENNLEFEDVKED